MSEVICRNAKRQEEVRKKPQLNGLDYLEVGEVDSSENQHVLRVYFLGKAPVDLDASNVRIEGGRRIRDIQVEKVEVQHYDTVELDDYMVVTVDRPGDFSTYTLRVVERNRQGEQVPHSAFDQRYNNLDFSFKVDCPDGLDCKQEKNCPLEPLREPEINYLAKDYSSFRQLIFDRLALIMPEWQERHVPDIGMTLVEILAYTGDHLSYYQDAVATEAYLHTARQRISVRRHARLVDYTMHEGCNARAWVAVETSSKLTLSTRDFFFIAGADEALPTGGNVLAEEDLRQLQAGQYEVFEPLLYDADERITLYKDHNQISFYTWGDQECCLPHGATGATLCDGSPLKEEGEQVDLPCEGEDNRKQEQGKNSKNQHAVESEQLTRLLHLQEGDILIFEEVKGPVTGQPADAAPRRRHAVRLTEIKKDVDRLTGTPVLEISWAEEDALPFPLCITTLGPAPDCRVLENISIARGNIILVDHGRTIRAEELGPVPIKQEVEQCGWEGRPAEKTMLPGLYRPSLQYAPLTFRQPFAPATKPPASGMLIQDMRQALPHIKLTGTRKFAASKSNKDERSRWRPQAGLLASGPDDRHFVVEMDNDGRAHLRFGNGEFGEEPKAGMRFQAEYRIGNGPAGNVGADAIAHLVLRKSSVSRVNVTVRNPMPAQGGTAAEPMEEAKLFAPRAFLKKQQRAVTAEDYAALVEGEFKSRVQRAAARLRWNGSWHEVLVAVDPLGQDEADQELLDAIKERLYRYRRIGHDLKVISARLVPLDIAMTIRVLPDYLRGHVQPVLLNIFSDRLLADGSRGFFHPDNLSFGKGIHLSRLVATAQAVTGVESVTVTRLQRLNVPSDQAIEDGVLPISPFEVARLDNDPSFPENGTLKLQMEGGRR